MTADTNVFHYTGLLRLWGEFDALALGDTPITELLADCPMVGRKVFVRWLVNPTALPDWAAAQAAWTRQCLGIMEVDDDPMFGSDCTGQYAHDQTLRIGGHDLLEELRLHIGQWAAIEIRLHSDPAPVEGNVSDLTKEVTLTATRGDQIGVDAHGKPIYQWWAMLPMDPNMPRTRYPSMEPPGPFRVKIVQVDDQGNETVKMVYEGKDGEEGLPIPENPGTEPELNYSVQATIHNDGTITDTKIGPVTKSNTK